MDHNVPLDIVERISLDIQSNSWEPNIPLSHTNDEAPRQLAYLYLDQSIGLVFNNWMTLGDVTWSRMSQLTVFRAHAKIFPDIVDVLCRGFLPKLKILDCYYDPKESGRCRSIYNRARQLSMDAAQSEEIFCIDVHASSRGPAGHYFERTDFRHNPALEELVIIGTWLERMPILSPSCKKLIMSSTTSRFWICLGARWSLIASFIATSARCDGSRLTSLNLANCPGLFFSTPTYGAVLMARIVQCCPSLRKLNVSENSSVGDFVLLEISKLRYLEYLDISCTGVHDLGVLLLLKGLFLGLSVHMDYLCKDSVLREMIQNNRALLLADDPAAYPMVFNTLIANECQSISDDVCWWIEDIGIRIECKLFTETNIKKRKREEIELCAGNALLELAERLLVGSVKCRCLGFIFICSILIELLFRACTGNMIYAK
ncbi:hypothetical protein V1515DRAFT_645466 [Lipomyces mesembrius]